MLEKNRKAKGSKYVAIIVVMAALCVLALTVTVTADEPERLRHDPDDWQPDAPAEVAEVGTEWIAYFTQCPANDIACEEPQCMGFYDELVDAGWGVLDSFHWGNCNAWARDFKRSAVGGTENDWIDDVDIALFCDHGSRGWDSFWNQNLSSLHFGCDGPDNDCNVTPGEAYLSYGDNDLEWLAFKACSVLGDGGPAPFRDRGYWAATMDGLHLLLGFRNSSSCDPDFGETWAEYMLGWRWCIFGNCFWIRPPYTVKQAWFEAVDDEQPGGVCARVLAEESYFLNDYLWGRGYVYADYEDGDYTYRDHCSCTPPPVQLSAGVMDQIESVPVYSVMDRDVDVNYVLDIAAAFGISGTDVYSDSEYYYMINSSNVNTYTLQVDKITGGYKYRDASGLWASPVETPTLPLADEALMLGNEFFAGAGSELPAADYRNGQVLTFVEEEVEVQQIAPEIGRYEEQILGSKPVLLSLSYGRIVPAQLVMASGRTQVQDISLVGPGARTKMYFGDGGDILGVQGGSRDVQTTGAVVDTMTADKAWQLYVADPSIALNPIPQVYDTVTKTAETLAYYEMSHTEGQANLIPTWVFSTTFLAESQVVAEGVLVYVPAAADYLPPQVSIDAPADGAVLSPGMVSFSGSVVQYGMAPFTYEWSSSHDGKLGNGQTLDAPLTAALAKGDLTLHTITLYVTDANGQHGSASVQVLVKAQVYLPIILKD